MTRPLSCRVKYCYAPTLYLELFRKLLGPKMKVVRYPSYLVIDTGKRYDVDGDDDDEHILLRVGETADKDVFRVTDIGRTALYIDRLGLELPKRLWKFSMRGVEGVHWIGDELRSPLYPKHVEQIVEIVDKMVVTIQRLVRAAIREAEYNRILEERRRVK